MDLNRDKPKYPAQVLKMNVNVAPSINHMYIFGSGHKTLTKDAKNYVQQTQSVCAIEMNKQKWKKDEEHVWYYMDLYFFFSDKRIRDSHNCIKLLLDSLQGLLFKNDYYVMPRVQNVGYDKENPHIEIRFFPQDVG